MARSRSWSRAQIWSGVCFVVATRWDLDAPLRLLMLVLASAWFGTGARGEDLLGMGGDEVRAPVVRPAVAPRPLDAGNRQEMPAVGSPRWPGLPEAELSWVRLSEANHGLQVAVLRSGRTRGPGFQVHLHFRGDVQVVLPPRARKFEDLISESWAAAPDTVFLLPEGVSRLRGADGRWNQVQHGGKLVDEALRRAGIEGVPRQLLVSAFSGAGRALGRLLVTARTDPDALRGDRIVLLDTPLGRLLPLLEARVASGTARLPLIHVDAGRPGWTHPVPRERDRLGLESPVDGPFAPGVPAPTGTPDDLHYLARDAYFTRYLARPTGGSFEFGNGERASSVPCQRVTGDERRPGC